MITIDRSVYKNLNPILNSALECSLLTGRPFRIINRDHNPCSKTNSQNRLLIRSCQKLCSADVINKTNELIFSPEDTIQTNFFKSNCKEYQNDSETLSMLPLIKTILIPLSHQNDETTLRFHGGTHVNGHQPLNYLESVMKPIYNKLGYEFNFIAERWGFDPVGQGIIKGSIQPKSRDSVSNELSLTERGELEDLTALSALGNLDPDILRKQTRQTEKKLRRERMHATVKSQAVESLGPGSMVFIQADYENVRVGFFSYGKKSKPARAVAREAVNNYLNYHHKDEPLNSPLGFELILPLALEEQMATIRVTKLTDRLLDRVKTINQFEISSIEVERAEGDACSLRIP